MDASPVDKEGPALAQRVTQPGGGAPGHDCAPEDLLVLSTAPMTGKRARQLAARYPGSPILAFTTEDVRLFRLPFAPVRKLRARRYRVVVAGSGHWKLMLLARFARADRRAVAKGSGLEPIRIGEIAREAARGIALQLADRPVVAKGSGLEPIRIGDIARLAALGIALRLARAAEKASLKRRVPSPAGPGNDYAFIARRVRRAGPEYQPRLVASVIVPVYNRRAVLEKTLAALTLQTYPRELFEVIVADDGSADRPEEVAARFAGALEIRTVRQEDDGYRLAAVRNLGIRAARGDVIVSLDCDMLPEPGWLEAHMRWFHAWDGSLITIGLRRDVDTEGVSAGRIRTDFDVIRRIVPRPVPSGGSRGPRSPEDWRLESLRRTRWLREHPAPYRLASGGNVAFRKRDAEAAGLYDEDFRSWGAEDLEFAYRLYRRGAYLVPDAAAFAHHQTHPLSPTRDAELEASRRMLGRKVPACRPYAPDGAWEVPKISVYMPAHNAAAFIRRAVESALAQTVTDLEVCICDDGSTDGTDELLARHYSDHPRVRWVSQARGGVGSASMRALSLCRGEYILQLDADDELLPRAAEVLAAELDRHPGASLVCGGYRICDAAGNDGAEKLPPRYSVVDHLVRMVIRHPRMFRARDFFRTAGFAGPAAVDYDISLKLAEQGEVRVVQEVLYRYRRHGGNLSLREAGLQEECRLRAIRSAFDRRGLDWDVVAPDPDQPRNLTIKVPGASLAARLGRLCQALESRISKAVMRRVE